MIKKYSGILVIIILTIFPIIIWAFYNPLDKSFAGIYNSAYSLGKISALAGIVLFSMTLILSTRLHIFDKLFNGLNRVYIIHHTLGALAFVLLLFHPILLTARYFEISIASAANFLLSIDDIPKDIGALSLAIMIILLFFTFFFRPKYHIWKNSHKFLGLAFFLGSLHVFLTPSDVSGIPVLKYYMLTIVSLGLTAYIYKTILGNLTITKFDYEVVGKKNLRDNIIEITLRPLEKIMKYEAGQFVFVSFDSQYLSKESHPFSISSNSNENNLKITVKVLGDFTSSLLGVKTGDKVKIEGPFGKFNFKNIKNKKQIWISGGIGITPFLGMIDELASRENTDFQVEFYNCIRNLSENLLDEESPSSLNTNKKINLHTHCSEKKGHISADLIAKQIPDFMTRDFLICGPAGLNESLKKGLGRAGIKKANIHTEEFNLS